MANITSADLRTRVLDALRTIYDPEIPLNIYDLGLIYGLDVEPTGQVRIAMTLTSPGCPIADAMPVQVAAKVRAVTGVTGAEVRLVWDPPWTPDTMSEAARLELGLDTGPLPTVSFYPASELLKNKDPSSK